jgi:ATP-dependent DNA helicase RecG
MTEKQNIEYKESWRDEYLKWVAGFANARGGVIYVGKNDSGKTVGIRNSKKLMVDIPNKIRNILGVTTDVSLHTEDGKEYIEIDIRPSSAPISYNEEFYYRSGSTKHALAGTSLTEFLLSKSGKTWDSISVDDVEVKDLHEESFDIFRKNAVNSKRMTAKDLRIDNRQLLINLGLLTDEKPNRAAVLLFHKNPERWIQGSYIKVGCFETESEIKYQDEIHGSLFVQAEKSIDLIFTKYLKALITYEGVTRVETYPYPKEAIREALYNPIIHKPYQSLNPIQIKIYDSGMLISNTWRKPDGWTANTILRDHGSEPYNPLVANAFFRAGLVETWGRGVRKIFDECRNHGNPEPKYDVYPKNIMLRIEALTNGDISKGPQRPPNAPKRPL